MKALADQGWVVLDEPLPPGAIVLGGGLGNDSALLSADGSNRSLWPQFEERLAGHLRMYFRWVPQGEHVIEYKIRLNQAGQFQLPALRLEAMYDPDVFAELPLGNFEVGLD